MTRRTLDCCDAVLGPLPDGVLPSFFTFESDTTFRLGRELLLLLNFRSRFIPLSFFAIFSTFPRSFDRLARDSRTPEAEAVSSVSDRATDAERLLEEEDLRECVEVDDEGVCGGGEAGVGMEVRGRG